MAVVAEGGVMVLGLPVFADYYGDPPEQAVAVEVTGRQFFWTVRYPGGDAEFGATDPGLVTIDNPIGLVAADPRGSSSGRTMSSTASSSPSCDSSRTWSPG